MIALREVEGMPRTATSLHPHAVSGLREACHPARAMLFSETRYGHGCSATGSYEEFSSRGVVPRSSEGSGAWLS